MIPYIAIGIAWTIIDVAFYAIALRIISLSRRKSEHLALRCDVLVGERNRAELEAASLRMNNGHLQQANERLTRDFKDELASQVETNKNAIATIYAHENVNARLRELVSFKVSQAVDSLNELRETIAQGEEETDHG